MKLFKIAMCNLSQQSREGKVVFRLLFCSAFFCILFVIYAYGNILPGKIIAAVNSPYSRSITVRFPEKETVKYEDMACLDDYSIAEVILESTTDYSIPFLEINMNLVAFRENNQGGEYFDENCIFTSQEAEEDGVIVSIDHPGNTLQLNGKTYPIIRKSNRMDAGTAFIPINLLIKARTSIDSIEYVFDTFAFQEHMPEIYAKLASIFPKGQIVGPADTREAIGAENVKSFAFIWAVFAICTIFLCVLEKHALSVCAFSFAVFKSVGANRIHLVTILLLQNALLFVGAFILAAAIHIGCYQFFDTWANLFQNISYSAMDYLYILATLLIITTFVDFPFAWKYIVKTTVDLSDVSTR